MAKTIDCDCKGDNHADGCETECLCCWAMIPSASAEVVPPVDDDAAWAEIAGQHADDCEWVRTRAHRRPETHD